MNDRDVVQAFLVADEVLRRKHPGPDYCRWVSIRTDARMPRDLVAVGYCEGAIQVTVVNPGNPPVLDPDQ